MEPQFPLVAAAQADGELSDRHAAVVTRTVEKLPVEVRDEFGDWLESTLVEHGRHLDPALLDRHARQLAYRLDQDGQFEEERYREKTRRFDVHPRPDGSARVEGELTAECAAHLMAQLDALTKPKPSSETGPDPRTATQRRHDAFEAMMKLVARAELLPQGGWDHHHRAAATWTPTPGSPATAPPRTGHGYTVSAETAKRWAGGDARLVLTLLDKAKAVEAYATSQRIFTEAQRLAIITRDRGCTFVDCDAGPQWSEINHVPRMADHAPHPRRRRSLGLLRRSPTSPGDGLATDHDRRRAVLDPPEMARSGTETQTEYATRPATRTPTRLTARGTDQRRASFHAAGRRSAATPSLIASPIRNGVTPSSIALLADTCKSFASQIVPMVSRIAVSDRHQADRRHDKAIVPAAGQFATTPAAATKPMM